MQQLGVFIIKLSFPFEMAKFQIKDVFGIKDVIRVADILKLVLIRLCSYWYVLGVGAHCLSWLWVRRKQAAQQYTESDSAWIPEKEQIVSYKHAKSRDTRSTDISGIT